METGLRAISSPILYFWHLKLIKIIGYQKQIKKLFNNSLKTHYKQKIKSQKFVVPQKTVFPAYSGLSVSNARVLLSSNTFDDNAQLTKLLCQG